MFWWVTLILPLVFSRCTFNLMSFRSDDMVYDMIILLLQLVYLGHMVKVAMRSADVTQENHVITSLESVPVLLVIQAEPVRKVSHIIIVPQSNKIRFHNRNGFTVVKHIVLVIPGPVSSPIHPVSNHLPPPFSCSWIRNAAPPKSLHQLICKMDQATQSSSTRLT